MTRETYHHGDLKQEMIHNGVLLLNKEGVEGFSLRKVASMCGVSHTAPYKHFKDKEELIQVIIGEVWRTFYLTLLEVTEIYKEDPKIQIIEMGKAYVRFMVENPEYLKFMFLSDNVIPVKIENNVFHRCEGSSFEVFKSCAEKYLASIQFDKNKYMEETLMMWSMVHGVALLIAKKSIEYSGDYLELVERMIRTTLELKM